MAARERLITKKEALQMKKYREQGYTYRAIAEHFGVSHAAVRYHLMKMGCIKSSLYSVDIPKDEK